MTSPEPRAPTAINRIAMNGSIESEYFDLTSETVGDTFRIFVARPLFGMRKDCPVVITTDGNSAFALVSSIQRTLSLGEVPPALVVGVGYALEGNPFAALQKRNRDYTPTPGGEYAQQILGSVYEPGAAGFLKFLVTGLFPVLRETYSISETDITFIGTSLGGLFGTWTLLTAPSTFRRYILASPSLFWNDEEVWHWEADFGLRNKDVNASVYLGAGSLETAEGTRRSAMQLAESGASHLRDRAHATIDLCNAKGWPRTAEIIPELASRLRSRHLNNLRVLEEIVPGETHLSASAILISRGLRRVIDDAPPPEH